MNARINHFTVDNNGQVNVTELAIYETVPVDAKKPDGETREQLVATRQLRTAIHVPPSGPQRGQAIAQIQQTLASMRQEQAGRPSEVVSIEQELSLEA